MISTVHPDFSRPAFLEMFLAIATSKSKLESLDRTGLLQRLPVAGDGGGCHRYQISL